jgi:hypothetical protein
LKLGDPFDNPDFSKFVHKYLQKQKKAVTFSYNLSFSQRLLIVKLTKLREILLSKIWRVRIKVGLVDGPGCPYPLVNSFSNANNTLIWVLLQ